MVNEDGKVVSVLIVDDHRKFSEALSAMLEPEPGIRVLAQVHDSRHVKAKVVECNPNVVLMDYHMPFLNGIELTKLLLLDKPELKILVVSLYNEETLIKSFKRVGARGYLFKTASAAEVINATLKVYAGEYYFPQITTGETDDHRSGALRLSDREVEIIQLIKAGLKPREIAEKLHISCYTAETHRNNIKLKTGAKSEADFMKIISGI
jgi:DNA-binding NarL/FixJ family response regulator